MRVQAHREQTRHLEEVGPAMDPTQGAPGFDVGGLVVAVARIDVVMDGHGPILGDTQVVVRDSPLSRQFFG
jgi:hypothetical protein